MDGTSRRKRPHAHPVGSDPRWGRSCCRKHLHKWEGAGQPAAGTQSFSTKQHPGLLSRQVRGEERREEVREIRQRQPCGAHVLPRWGGPVTRASPHVRSLHLVACALEETR